MINSRSRFEAWYLSLHPDCICETFAPGNVYKRNPGEYTTGTQQAAWRAWQEAERETAIACVDHINSHSTVDDRSAQMIAGIKTEFPEAFK